MFTLPTLQDIKIVGIDPGTTSLGLTVISIDPYTYQINSINANTYLAKNLPTYNKYLSSVHGDLMARVSAYKEFLVDLFREIKPSLIGSESPFFYRTHPGAYGPLVETLAAIREAVWIYDNNLPLFTVPPSNVKQAIGAKGNAKKEDMIIALSNFKPFNLDQSFINQLDEHSIDSIAVCAAMFKEYIWRN